MPTIGEEAREHLNEAIHENIKPTEKSMKIAQILCDVGEKDIALASCLWNELIYRHAEKDRKFYIAAVRRRMCEMAQTYHSLDLFPV